MKMVFMLYMKKMQEIATEKWDNVKYVCSKQTDLKKLMAMELLEFNSL